MYPPGCGITHTVITLGHVISGVMCLCNCFNSGSSAQNVAASATNGSVETLHLGSNLNVITPMIPGGQRHRHFYQNANEQTNVKFGELVKDGQ